MKRRNKFINRRLTETVPIFAAGGFAGYDTIPKLPYEKYYNLQEFLDMQAYVESYFNHFHGYVLKKGKYYHYNEKGEKSEGILYEDMILSFFINLPIDELELISKYNKKGRLYPYNGWWKGPELHYIEQSSPIYLMSSDIAQFMQFFQKRKDAFMVEINFKKSLSIFHKRVTEILIDLYEIFCSQRKDINRVKVDNPSKSALYSPSLRFYVLTFPLLKELNILGFNLIFREYLNLSNLILNLHGKKKRIFIFTFINRYLHHECTNKHDKDRITFFDGFENLKEYKTITNKHYLSFEDTDKLFEFIIYLKMYYQIVVTYDTPLNPRRSYTKFFQKNHAIIYYRIRKKYLPLFYGKRRSKAKVVTFESISYSYIKDCEDQITEIKDDMKRQQRFDKIMPKMMAQLRKQQRKDLLAIQYEIINMRNTLKEGEEKEKKENIVNKIHMINYSPLLISNSKKINKICSYLPLHYYTKRYKNTSVGNKGRKKYYLPFYHTLILKYITNYKVYNLIIYVLLCIIINLLFYGLKVKNGYCEPVDYLDNGTSTPLTYDLLYRLYLWIAPNIIYDTSLYLFHFTIKHFPYDWSHNLHYLTSDTLYYLYRLPYDSLHYLYYFIMPEPDTPLSSNRSLIPYTPPIYEDEFKMYDSYESFMRFYKMDILEPKEPISITYLRATLYTIEICLENLGKGKNITPDEITQISNLLFNYLHYEKSLEVTNNIIENISILNIKVKSPILHQIVTDFILMHENSQEPLENIEALIANLERGARVQDFNTSIEWEHLKHINDPLNLPEPENMEVLVTDLIKYIEVKIRLYQHAAGIEYIDSQVLENIVKESFLYYPNPSYWHNFRSASDTLIFEKSLIMIEFLSHDLLQYPPESLQYHIRFNIIRIINKYASGYNEESI